jgi:hypothetical protein
MLSIHHAFGYSTNLRLSANSAVPDATTGTVIPPRTSCPSSENAALAVPWSLIGGMTTDPLV